jgi:serine protease AprX
MQRLLTRLTLGQKASRIIHWLVLVAILFSYFSVLPAPVRAASVQPELWQAAQQQPDAPLQVIVQKSSAAKSVEAWLASQGGTITQDLTIIQGFAATLPAHLLPQLAAQTGVRTISLDGAVQHTAGVGFLSTLYLYNIRSDRDTNSQSTPLPLSSNRPVVQTLRNYDMNRDNGPGLVIWRGGTLDSAETSGRIQRWRLSPFSQDTRINGDLTFKIYASLKNFIRNKTGKFTVYLNHIDSAGKRVATITNLSISQTWDDKWKLATLKTTGLDYMMPANSQLEVAIVVDATSADDMWFAFGTAGQPSALVSYQQDSLLTTSSFYLYNDPVPSAGNTPAHALLPIGVTKPTQTTLYNYDSNRDSNAGLLIRRGGGANSDLGSLPPDQVQMWALPPFNADTQYVGNAELNLFDALNNPSSGKNVTIWGYLLEVDSLGQIVRVIAQSSVKTSTDSNFHGAKISFGNVNTFLTAGNRFGVAVTVDPSSYDDLRFAYATGNAAAYVTGNFWYLAPSKFVDASGARRAWAQGYQGQGVRVAVLDSGIWSQAQDFTEVDATGHSYSRVVASVGVAAAPDGKKPTSDQYGHGTYMAGAIAGNGNSSGGYYQGIAPKADLVNVRVSDEWGGAKESDVVAGMQWVLQNKDTYNIRVVNLSLNSNTQVPYQQSPLDAAAEILWFNGIVVVTAGGNNGVKEPGIIYPPANDPYLIAVGATDDMGTGNTGDDEHADFSVYGQTPEGVSRPDFSAPGSFIVSTLANQSNFVTYFPNYQNATINTNGDTVNLTFVASGTSVSAAEVSGAVALLLQAVPGLNPDQVKYLLITSATPLDGEPGVGSGTLNIAKAIQLARSYGSAGAVPAVNTGRPVSQLLTTGSNAIQWNSVNWNSVNWNSVNWNSVNWNSVNWNSVNWNSVGWNSGGQTPASVDEKPRNLHAPILLGDGEEATNPDDANATPALPDEPSHQLFVPFVQGQ